MNSAQPGDLTLETLLSVAREIAPDLSEDLIKTVYALQRSHQFDSGGEREISIQSLQRILEEHIALNESVKGVAS
jgi:hypothetical protein